MRSGTALISVAALTSLALSAPASAQQPATQQPTAQQKPNIIMIVSDDTGYGDLGPYGGGVGRGMPTPNIDRLASEGMDVLSLSMPSRAARPAALRCRPDAFRTAAA